MNMRRLCWGQTAGARFRRRSVLRWVNLLDVARQSSPGGAAAGGRQAGTAFDLLVPVIVRPGTERDAKLEGLSDNAEHGLRRTVEDKRKAVDWALSDPELSQWSNAKIARQMPGLGAVRRGEARDHAAEGSAVANSGGAASLHASTSISMVKRG